MTPESGWGEQALNKIAEIAISSQLEEFERLEVQIKTDLSKLAHGEVDSIDIRINGLAMPQDLVAEELNVRINRIIVKPLRAIFGKIELTQPCTGTIQIVINEDNLNRACNSESFRQNLHQNQAYIQNKREKVYLQQVKSYLLADGNIAFNCTLILGENREVQPVVFIATPGIGTDGKKIVFQNVRYVEGKELPPEYTAAFFAQMSEVLSLHNFEQKGMLGQIQQFDVVPGKLTWLASAYIDHFPSS